MSTILVAIGDRIARRSFAAAIKESPELERFSIKRSSNFAGLSESLEDIADVSLIVMDYDLPPGRLLDPGEDGNLPVGLATSFDDNGPRCLILGPLAKADRHRFELCENCAWIPMTDFLDPLNDSGSVFGTSKIARMLASAAPEGDPPAQEGGVIDLIIGRLNTMSCNTYLVEYGRFIPLHSREPFHYDSGIVDDMAIYTQNLSDENQLTPEAFLSNYRSIGRKARAILNNHGDTRDAIRDLIAKVGGREKIWVRFLMFHDDLPVAPFEAILQCDLEDDQNDDFQLAYSPVYRIVRGANQLGTSIRTPILSKHINRNPDKISCLVINASTSGPVNPVDGISFPKLKAIDSAAKETQNVVQIFTDMKAAGLVSKIDCLNFDSDAEKRDPAAAMRDKLTQRKWDIVHYNGHSYFGGDDGNAQGYVFLPGDSLAQPVNIDILSDWCRNTDFVFMSSCQSAAPGFIHALAGKGIPMIVGYRWKVSDSGAACFAERFYRELFNDNKIGNIESAFSVAQRSLKSQQNGSLPENVHDMTVWASSMLVLQNV